MIDRNKIGISHFNLSKRYSLNKECCILKINIFNAFHYFYLNIHLHLNNINRNYPYIKLYYIKMIDKILSQRMK